MNSPPAEIGAQVADIETSAARSFSNDSAPGSLMLVVSYAVGFVRSSECHLVN